MMVMILERVPPALRGELTRWLIEPHTGTFVGHVSALVRDKLWWKCVQSQEAGGVIQIWSTNTEQRFAMRKSGDTDRRIVDFDGIQLIRIPRPPTSTPDAPADQPRRRRGNRLRISMPDEPSATE
jgi:CRISPR-associated protein Cas2